MRWGVAIPNDTSLGLARTRVLGARVTAGRGVEKVEPGSEKILGVGLNFKIGICLAHPRSDVGLEKLRALGMRSICQEH